VKCRGYGGRKVRAATKFGTASGITGSITVQSTEEEGGGGLYIAKRVMGRIVRTKQDRK
jgi:hypothetical protein